MHESQGDAMMGVRHFAVSSRAKRAVSMMIIYLFCHDFNSHGHDCA
jgi:hypothetical protein